MAQAHFVTLATSHRTLPQGATRVADVPADEPIELSLYLKPTNNAAEAEIMQREPTRKREALHAYRSDAYRGKIAQIKAFADENGLQVTAIEPGRRLVKLKGSAQRMQQAFQTQVAMYEHQGRRFRGRSGLLSAPQDIADGLESVLGFDTRPVAVPHFFTSEAFAPAIVTAHLPNAVGQLYQFPARTGAGQTIALIELGGGYLDSDNATAFAAMGLAVPNIIAVPVDGATNAPGGDADGEVALDIQVAGGIAPGSTIAVYFAPNTSQGFIDAITQAAQDTTNAPHVMSISWGNPEANWAAQDIQSMNSALQDAASVHVSVFVAAGDHLGTDNLDNGRANVDFPASSPWAIGCGGTNINTTGNTITDEKVWNSGASGWGTGGGISDLFPVPSFQANTALPVSVNDGATRRGVPDVCADADNASGYQIVLNGAAQPIGGTSAVAPLWAGLTALINQAAAAPIGFFLPTLYQNPGALRDITSGNNKPDRSNLGYEAGPGWDACTGLGSPKGSALLALFAPSV